MFLRAYAASKVMRHFGIDKLFPVKKNNIIEQNYSYGWKIWKIFIWSYVIGLAFMLPSKIVKVKEKVKAENTQWLNEQGRVAASEFRSIMQSAPYGLSQSQSLRLGELMSTPGITDFVSKEEFSDAVDARMKVRW